MQCKKFTEEEVIKICKNVHRDDSYIVSPVYYLMTGRNGGMIYRENNQTVITIIHPNLKDWILVFPALSIMYNQNQLSFEIKVAQKIINENPSKKVKIARVPWKLAEKYQNLVVEEDLLDWRYPVYILDVNSVLSLKGKNYQQIRQRLNNFDAKLCFEKQIAIIEDRNTILDISAKWASEFPYLEYSISDLLSPTERLLTLMERSELKIEGHIIYYKGKASAFCIWEKRDDIANAYAMSADRSIAGLAEYNIFTMCKLLYLRGISRVNIGGSESIGLNRFKKKFSPVQAILLKSCIIR